MPVMQTARAKAMYEMYQSRHSPIEIGKAFGCTYQAVYRMFARHGLKTKNEPAKPLPYVVFQEKKYTRKKSGYYASTDRHHSLLHRDVWIASRGAIPEGMHVHHIDENQGNNQIGNLELRTNPDHASLHMTKRRRKGFRPATEWSHGMSPEGNRARR